MSKQWELVFSGSGGQGVILAGIILAAAALEQGFNVIQTQSYGPEARGGASRSEVLISDDELAYPKVQACNLLVALTQQALDKYSPILVSQGIVITDCTIETSQLSSDCVIHKIAIFDTVKELGNPLVTNMVALGAVNGIAKLVSQAALAKAAAIRVPKPTVEINLKALSMGADLARR